MSSLRRKLTSSCGHYGKGLDSILLYGTVLQLLHTRLHAVTKDLGEHRKKLIHILRHAIGALGDRLGPFGFGPKLGLGL